MKQPARPIAFSVVLLTATVLAGVTVADTPATTPPARLADWSVADFQAHGHVIEGPKGESRPQFIIREWKPKTLVDLRNSSFFANEDGEFSAGKAPPTWPGPAAHGKLKESSGGELYPVSIHGSPTEHRDVLVLGPKVIGVQPREVPWRLIKALYDGDGVRMEGAGEMVVRDGVFENVEDAVSPRGTGYWVVRGTRGKYIRDDFVENDGLLSGEIDDCLVECHVLLSARPGKQAAADAKQMAAKAANPPVVKIRNCLAHLPGMPYDGDMKLSDQKYIVNGKAGGKLFKWSANGGAVEVSDSIFRLDMVAATGPNSMEFPKGAYRNVTVVWTGPGEYPAKLPDGVTVTKDVGVWDRAEADWVKRHQQ